MPLDMKTRKGPLLIFGALPIIAGLYVYFSPTARLARSNLEEIPQIQESVRATQWNIFVPNGVGPFRIGDPARILVEEARKRGLLLKSTLAGEDGDFALALFKGNERVLIFNIEGPGKIPPEFIEKELMFPLEFLKDKKISFISTSSSEFQTEKGIHPGSDLLEAQKAYGSAKITESGFLFAIFENHPRDKSCANNFYVDYRTVDKAGYDREKGGPIEVPGIEIHTLTAGCS